MRCHRCETEAPADATFCDGCGERLESACPTCHAVNRPGARFCKACGAPLTTDAPTPAPRLAAPHAYTPSHLAERILTTRSALEGELKQVSVLFADVEDFTGLGAALDPESLHGLMDRVFATLLDLIHRYEGTVNQFTGDGVMALFGAPLALEDHALRAVQAALDIQHAMRSAAGEFETRWGRAPALRIGLNTGRVVVGKIGDDLRMDYTAQGDTVNLAARLQAIAAPGTVAMSETTYRLVKGHVECVPLGPHHVKGREAPVEVYRPERVIEETADRTTGHALSPFVDREAELAILLDLYEDVRAGRARTAVVTGEAGMGKSRLILEFRRRVDDSDPRWFEGHCAPYGRHIPYRPVVEIVRRMCGLEEDDTEATARQKLGQLLAGLGDEGRQIEPALAYVLALGPGNTEMAVLSPSERKVSVTLAFDRLIQRSSRERPHVFVVRDWQWIDPASAEYVSRVSREMTRGMILLILTSRPGESARAQFESTGTHIGLRPLAPSQSQKLIRLLAAPAPLPDDRVALMVDRTGGNPLFIEEVTRTIRESEAVEIPPTVADVLAARIDRLPDAAKTVLQVASVIGREFSRQQLDRVVDDGTDIDPVLRLLTEMGLVAETAGAPGSYLFRQGLLQETAYEGLLRERRRVLHRRVGEALEELYPDRLFEHVDVLARHFLRAEDWGRAAFYLREAGRKAAALSANREATERLERALEVVSRMPDTLERSRLAADIRLDLRPPLLQLGRLDDLLRMSREAEELARMLGDERRLARVYVYLINYHYLKGEPDVAIDYGRRCLEMEDRPSVAGVERSARQYLATSYHALGRYAMAAEMLTGNIDDLERRDEWTRAGPENLLYVTSCGWLGWTHVETGDFASAHAWTDRAVAAAENAYARAIAQSMAALVWLRQGHADRAAPLLETALGLCHEHHLIVWEPIPSSLLGLALTLHGDVGRGLTLLHDAVAQTEKLGVNAYRSLWETHLADGLLVAGQTHRAVEVARAAVDLAVQCKEAGNHATALLVLGEAYRRSGETGFARAGDAIRQALVEGEELRMRPLIAHSYLALSHLAAAQGDREKQAEYLTTAGDQARAIDLRFWSDAVNADSARPARSGPSIP
jgi:class 3 adenylate cyclase/tetratricopeptide (TPR) repeat protein